MDFGNLARMLFTYYADGNTKPEFVVALVDSIIEDLSGDKINNSPLLSDGDYNPLFGMGDSILRKIFNSNRSISKQNASIILGRLDKYKFGEFILNRPTDTLIALCGDLCKYGYAANYKTVGDICSDIFEDILKKISASKRKTRHKPRNEELVNDGGKDNSAKETQSKLPVTPITAVYIKNGMIHFGATDTINLPKKLIPPVKVADREMGFLPILYEAYSDAEKPNNVTEENLHDYPKYRHNLNEQRECYYNALYVMERVRGLFAPEDGSQFDIFKQEIHYGISATHYDDYDNGFVRLKAVLVKATAADVGKSLLCNIPNLIGGSEKMGVCHILISDGILKSWVNVYG